MGLSRLLCLSICLKSSLYELSLDHARSVNTRVNPYHSGADMLAGALLSLWRLAKVQAGEVIDIGLQL